MRVVLITFFTVTLLFGSIYILGQIERPLPKMENPNILVKKKKRQLQVFDGRKLVKTYSISLGFAPEGDKETEGDGKTPEGDFYIFIKNDKSSFFLSLGLSYPNIEDAERGLKEGLITQAEYDEIVKAINEKAMPPQKTKLGGEIYIHGGGCNSDWTAGCMAMKNEEMQEIFDTLEVGTPVRIEP
jgi:murein L,D-transpeptidase YafK